VSRIPNPSVEAIRSQVIQADDLNGFLEGLELDGMVVLHGSHLCHEVAELLCVKAGSRDGSAILVDAGNTFNPLRASELAAGFGLGTELALERIKVNRVFTCFELSTLITRDLAKALTAYNPKLVAITGFIEPYCEREVQPGEAKLLFNRSLKILAQLSRGLPIVITHALDGGKTQRSILFWRILTNYADALLRIKKEGRLLKIALQRRV